MTNTTRTAATLAALTALADAAQANYSDVTFSDVKWIDITATSAATVADKGLSIGATVTSNVVVSLLEPRANQ